MVGVVDVLDTADSMVVVAFDDAARGVAGPLELSPPHPVKATAMIPTQRDATLGVRIIRLPFPNHWPFGPLAGLPPSRLPRFSLDPLALLAR